jgi:hypothetical protein
MSEERIKRKALWQQLGNVDLNDWLRTAKAVGLNVTSCGKGTSHGHQLRDPKIAETDIRGLVTTLTPNCFKQANQKIFKRVLTYCQKNGHDEDDVWRGLGLLR